MFKCSCLQDETDRYSDAVGFPEENSNGKMHNFPLASSASLSKIEDVVFQ